MECDKVSSHVSPPISIALCLLLFWIFLGACLSCLAQAKFWSIFGIGFHMNHWDISVETRLTISAIGPDSPLALGSRIVILVLYSNVARNSDK